MKSLLRAVLCALLLVAGALSAPSAQPAHAAATPSAAATGTAEAWTPPLSTRGRYIVDAQGNRFRLRSGNWDGAQGSWNGSGDRDDPATHHSGQNAHGIPIGLDRVPLPTLLADFRAAGLNSIRLPFSNEMLRDTAPVPDSAVAANPALRGRTPPGLRRRGRRPHRRRLRRHPQQPHRHHPLVLRPRRQRTLEQRPPTAQWADDWVFLARRYRDNPRVVGADLYNEVRRDVFDDPNWGLGDNHDWHAVAQEAADRILTEANPQLLIVVEGINWFGLPVDGFPHGRPTLTPVRTLSHTLVISNKLVYSAHFYGYTGPRHSGATGIGETSDLRYQDMTAAELEQTLYDQAFFVSAETGTHFTAPVWISEFGIGADESGAAPRAWFDRLTGYLTRSDADFAYWPLVGWSTTAQGTPGGDTWALLRYDTAGRRSGVLDPGTGAPPAGPRSPPPPAAPDRSPPPPPGTS